MAHLVLVLGVVFLPLFSCSDDDCDHACDKARECGLKTSGLSCDEDCKKDSPCSECVLVESCDAIVAGACATDCPGVDF